MGARRWNKVACLWANSKKAKKGAQEMNVYCYKEGME
jgi:hypothetical protein